MGCQWLWTAAVQSCLHLCYELTAIILKENTWCPALEPWSGLGSLIPKASWPVTHLWEIKGRLQGILQLNTSLKSPNQLYKKSKGQ